jgi:hypothetical protein
MVLPWGVDPMKDWAKYWEKLPKRNVQEWIKRILERIQRTIECEGNEYREGLGRRKKNPHRVHGVM